MTRPTASELDRAAVCPASCALPAARTESPWAGAGTAMHRYLELRQDMDEETALGAIEDDDHRELCAKVDVDRLPLGSLAAEVTFAFDYQEGTARELGRGLSRDYSGARETERCGTIDVVGVGDGFGYVGDYKLGFGDSIRAYDSWQLRFAAICVYLIHQVPEVRAEIIHVRPGGEPYISRATFAEHELALWACDLAEIYRRANEARAMVVVGRVPDVVEGPHCQYCPAAYRCPAKVALVHGLGAGGDPAAIEDLVGELTADTAAAAYRRLRAIKGVVKLVEDRIDRLALARPIPLGEGRFLGGVPKKGREYLDPDAVYKRVSELYGSEAAELAAPAERKALKKTLKEALRAAKEAGVVGSMAKAERALLDELRETGGVLRKPGRTVVDEFEAPECSVDGCPGAALGEGRMCGDCELEAEMAGGGE